MRCSTSWPRAANGAALPKRFPPFTTVQYYFHRWRDDGTLARINHLMVMEAREAYGRQPPTAGIADSQRGNGEAGHLPVVFPNDISGNICAIQN